MKEIIKRLDRIEKQLDAISKALGIDDEVSLQAKLKVVRESHIDWSPSPPRYGAYDLRRNIRPTIINLRSISLRKP